MFPPITIFLFEASLILFLIKATGINAAQRTTTPIISRYMGDPQTASAGIVDQIKTITTSVFGALGLIAVMLYSSWKLAIIGVVVILPKRNC